MGRSRGLPAGIARWAPLAAVVTACLVAFAWKVRIVAPIEYVGHGDAAAYATLADSLLHGRGLEVDYISWYFRKYDPAVTRPEDHWPPLYPLLIVPFFAALGETAFAAKLPSLLIAAVAWPLTLYALALRVTRSRAIALASALTILLFAPVFALSLHCLSDVTQGFLVTLTVLCALKGYDDPRWFWGMGAALAAAYYTKGSTLVLLPALAAYHAVRRTTASTQRGWTRQDTRFAAGLGLWLLLMLPWFVRNTIHFGNPVYSTHTPAAGYIGWQGWEEGTYTLYWGERPAPSPFDKLRQPAVILEKAPGFLGRYLWWLFVQWGVAPGHGSVRNLSIYLFGIPAALGIALFLLRPFSGPEYGLMLAIAGVQLAFLVVLWEPNDRLLLPILPFVVVIGWATLAAAVRRVAAVWTDHARAIASGAVLVSVALWSVHEIGLLRAANTFGGFPWKDGGHEWIDAGAWIREHAPGAIVMTRHPWELSYYSGAKAIQIPLAPLARIIEVAAFYGATHLIPDPTRAVLTPWVSGRVPGLERVYETRGLALYAIHFDALPAELKPPARRAGAARESG
jgi:hypothetical protein